MSSLLPRCGPHLMAFRWPAAIQRFNCRREDRSKFAASSAVRSGGTSCKLSSIGSRVLVGMCLSLVSIRPDLTTETPKDLTRIGTCNPWVDTSVFWVVRMPDRKFGCGRENSNPACQAGFEFSTHGVNHADFQENSPAFPMEIPKRLRRYSLIAASNPIACSRVFTFRGMFRSAPT